MQTSNLRGHVPYVDYHDVKFMGLFDILNPGMVRVVMGYWIMGDRNPFYAGEFVFSIDSSEDRGEPSQQEARVVVEARSVK